MKEWVKSYWVIILSILVGIFLSFTDLSNFVLNLIFGNFSSHMLLGFFRDFFSGFLYSVIPLAGIHFFFKKETSEMVKFGIAGAFIIPIIYFGLLYLNVPIIGIYQLHVIFSNILDSVSLPSFIYVSLLIILVATIGFLIGALICYIYGKVKGQQAPPAQVANAPQVTRA